MILLFLILKYLAAASMLWLYFKYGAPQWLFLYAFFWVGGAVALLKGRHFFSFSGKNAIWDFLLHPGDLILAGLGLLIFFNHKSLGVFVLIILIWIIGIYLRRRAVGIYSREKDVRRRQLIKPPDDAEGERGEGERGTGRCL